MVTDLALICFKSNQIAAWEQEKKRLFLMDGSPHRGRPLMSAWTTNDGETSYLLVPMDIVESPPTSSNASDKSE